MTGTRFLWDLPKTSKRDWVKQLAEVRQYPPEFFASEIFPGKMQIKNLDLAAERILDGVRNKEKIIIFGHDDLDGISSTYIMFDFLEEIGSQSHYYYIPNRMLEHHGLQRGFLDKVRDGNYKLVITVDGGISSYDAVEELNAMGVTVIITDHHLLPSKLPRAMAIVNPKQDKNEYEMLAGVGVTYLLLKKMAQLAEVNLKKSYLLWAAIGTLADKVPLTGVNRNLVKKAFAEWEACEDETIGLIRGNQTISDANAKNNFVSYLTKLLSGGRGERGEHLGLSLIIGKTAEKLDFLEKLIAEKNSYDLAMNEVLKLVDSLLPAAEDLVFIYYDEQDAIPYPLLGLAASLISLRAKVPAVFLKTKGEDIVCEARCQEGFNLVEAFAFCEKWLTQYGGHVKAAGFTTGKENLPGFCSAFRSYAKLQEESIKANKTIKIDIMVDFAALNVNCQEALEVFQPFGSGNPEPVVLIRQCPLEQLETFFYLQNTFPYIGKKLYDVVGVIKPPSAFQVLDYKEL